MKKTTSKHKRPRTGHITGHGRDAEEQRAIERDLRALERIAQAGAMLAPVIGAIFSRASSTPVESPVARVPGYFEGYQHAIDEARWVVRNECASCPCALCRKMMSDDEPLDPRLGHRPKGGQ